MNLWRLSFPAGGGWVRDGSSDEQIADPGEKLGVIYPCQHLDHGGLDLLRLQEPADPADDAAEERSLFDAQSPPRPGAGRQWSVRLMGLRGKRNGPSCPAGRRRKSG